MIDFISLVKKTGAYKTVLSDKLHGRLSHAYLIITPDEKCLDSYLKAFAKLIMCKENEPCLNCRTCRLIESGNFADAIFYPKGEKVITEDVDALIEESFIKPIETDKKLFALSHGETMNASVQNKLLKTIEEPPSNVYLLIASSSEHALLATVKSRVKKLEIYPFDEQTLFDALKGDCLDYTKLKSAIACGDGTVGGALKLYGDDNFNSVLNLASSTVVNMQSSKNVLDYTLRICAKKDQIDEYLSALLLIYRDMLVNLEGKPNLTKNSALYNEVKNAVGYNIASVINATEKINEAKKRRNFNANDSMTIEWLLFQILEGKYKWQKASGGQ